MPFHVIVGASAAGRVRRHRTYRLRLLRSGAQAADAAAQHSGDRPWPAATGALGRPGEQVVTLVVGQAQRPGQRASTSADGYGAVLLLQPGVVVRPDRCEARQFAPS